MKKPILFFTYALLHLSVSNGQTITQEYPPIQVAFLSDIHLQDVFGDFGDQNFPKTIDPATGKPVTIRTMQSQMNSTRLFNENYFALLAALDQLAKQGIKLIMVPGDYTDDGQPMNVKALQRIFDEYASTYNMRFFIIPGNHDPVTPFGSYGRKGDFLGHSGQEVGVSGNPTDQSDDFPVITDEINHWGYLQIVPMLKNFGFTPSKDDLFWAHPFQELDFEEYNFDQALEGSKIGKRVFIDPVSGMVLPDASYVVEPVEGVWFLAIDANSYTYTGDKSLNDSLAWKGSGIGFNVAALQKKHQLEWIKKITTEAKHRNKLLISFSHYPLVDFHDGMSQKMAILFGSDKFQLERVPDKEISSLYANAGIRLHFAGHMHLNDSEVFENKKDSTGLINIQVPSLAAFPPAYKTLTMHSHRKIEVRTEELTEVSNFDAFFDLYNIEHNHLSTKGDRAIWNVDVLKSSNYFDYTRFHLEELVRLRFIPSDWPEELANLISCLSIEEIKMWKESKSPELFLEEILSKNDTNGKLLNDFYLIKNGGDLGKELVADSRLDFYKSMQTPKLEDAGILSAQLSQFLEILQNMANDLPSRHFMINLDNLEIHQVD